MERKLKSKEEIGILQTLISYYTFMIKDAKKINILLAILVESLYAMLRKICLLQNSSLG